MELSDVEYMRQARSAIKKTVALVLAGGRGSRLKHLTDTRAKPAVYFGGKFRIIDFSLSNCVNSGIRKIGVVTQYKSHSLLKHIQSGWSFLDNQMNEFVDLLPAQQRIDEIHWYRGTADAIYQNVDIIKQYGCKYILVLSGDHVYKMDYSYMLLDHIKSGCPLSIACIEVPREQATAYGCMQVDENNRIISFREKPDDPPAVPGKPDSTLVSMGIYLFNADFLFREMQEDQEDYDSSHDFGKDVIPKIVKKGLANAHNFELSCVKNVDKVKTNYWRDVGNIDSFWSANLDLAAVVPELDIYDSTWPIWTYQLQLPPAKFVQDYEGKHGENVNSVVSAGCIISGSEVYNSVLFNSVRVHSKNFLEGVVAFPNVIIHRHCRIKNAIIDRNCVIPTGMEIGYDHEKDRKYFDVSKGGVTVINRDMLKKLKEDHPELFENIPERSMNRPRY